MPSKDIQRQMNTTIYSHHHFIGEIKIIFSIGEFSCLFNLDGYLQCLRCLLLGLQEPPFWCGRGSSFCPRGRLYQLGHLLLTDIGCNGYIETVGGTLKRLPSILLKFTSVAKLKISFGESLISSQLLGIVGLKGRSPSPFRTSQCSPLTSSKRVE